MSNQDKHKWEFRARFRKNAFGWRSQNAVTRVNEAVSEIKKIRRRDPALAGEGAVLFLEKVAPALAHVDSSSGAIGNALGGAVDELVPIISGAPVDDARIDSWLDRLWKALAEDDMPYLERLDEYWGELCVTLERASREADRLLGQFLFTLQSDNSTGSSSIYYRGTVACLSSLLKAGRNGEMLALIEKYPQELDFYREWGVKALLAMGRKAEALKYAEESRSKTMYSFDISGCCQEILLSSGLYEEAYNRYAMDTNWKSTYLATCREIVKKYPQIDKSRILEDLVASTPGKEGKWFAAAKWAGLYDRAIELAAMNPCDPRTLTRAARDMRKSEPRFATEAGLLALKWLVEGYGYEITNVDVVKAFDYTIEAARNAGSEDDCLKRIREIVASEKHPDKFVTRHLGDRLVYLSLPFCEL